MHGEHRRSFEGCDKPAKRASKMGARHITPAEVVEMHRLYKELGTYAAVAERIGRSASLGGKIYQNGESSNRNTNCG